MGCISRTGRETVKKELTEQVGPVEPEENMKDDELEDDVYDEETLHDEVEEGQGAGGPVSPVRVKGTPVDVVRDLVQLLATDLEMNGFCGNYSKAIG